MDCESNSRIRSAICFTSGILEVWAPFACCHKPSVVGENQLSNHFLNHEVHEGHEELAYCDISISTLSCSSSPSWCNVSFDFGWGSAALGPSW